jgi:hypothetical protein
MFALMVAGRAVAPAEAPVTSVQTSKMKMAKPPLCSLDPSVPALATIEALSSGVKRSSDLRPPPKYGEILSAQQKKVHTNLFRAASSFDEPALM